MALEKKKMAVLLLSCAALVGLVLLLVLLNRDSGKEKAPAGPASVSQELPDADTEDVPASKTQAYLQRGRSGIEDYWDQMGGDPSADPAEADDPLAELNGTKNGSSSAPSYEEVFGSLAGGESQKETPQQRAERQTRESRDAAMAMQQQQMDMLADIMRQQQAQQGQGDDAGEEAGEPAPAAVPERDRIDVERVRVVRSGGVSSMDDDFGSVSTSGVSSLDEDDRAWPEDESYPFRCMFVRQEKLKNSQRVAVRLLEDIVVEGQLVKKNTHLNAVCSIGDRIDLKVSSIDINGRIVNLDFDAYDNDGTRGIYAPDLSKDTMVEDMLKQAGVQGVRRRMSTAVGQTVQDILAAGSMVITGQGKDRSVTVPAGYQFYLVRSKKK